MPLHFVFCIHNHQPVGNFGFVLEKAYRKSYGPFLEVLNRHKSQKVVLHFSGILYQWFERNRPFFLEKLADLSNEGRIEFLTGGFYEPILVAIPEHDKLGQVRMMSDYIRDRFGQTPRGLWLAERVWEPSLPGCIAGSDLRFVVVDDFHLRAAGVSGKEITMPYLTADGNSVITVIGGSERLRYLIPFEDPERSIDYLREIHLADPEGRQIVTMADDGEKFGIWPGTHKRVYQDGWLDRFFELLEENDDWIRVSTFTEALSDVRPETPVFIPSISYMEMSEWTLSPANRELFGNVRSILNSSGNLGYTSHLLRGGHFRNFLTRYPESRYLFGRMTGISLKIRDREKTSAPADRAPGGLLSRARDELWQGQCNDAYWHGVFGGLYLPFLRAAIYEHLIKAETLLEEMDYGKDDFISIESVDLDMDGTEEILMQNRLLTFAVDPFSGTGLELDYKPAAINLQNSLTRREEAYHKRLLESFMEGDKDEVRSIHHIDKLKAEGPMPSINYDTYPRRSFVDHIWQGEYTYEDWRKGKGARSFIDKYPYASSRLSADREEVFLEMTSTPGTAWPRTKRIQLGRSGGILLCSLSFGPSDVKPFFVGQEFNLTPTSIEKSVIESVDDKGRVTRVPKNGGIQAGVREVRLVDTLRSLTLRFKSPGPVTLWTCTIKTVSNSESGYEEISQQISILLWSPVKEMNAGDAQFAISVEIE